jgi:arylformamidase
MSRIVSKIIDVSVSVREGMPIYDGNPPLSMEWAMSIERGDQVNLTRLSEGVHTGTHVDAPFHFIPGGRKIDELEMGSFFCNVQVIETRRKSVTPDVLKKKRIRKGDGVLFRTSNSKLYGKPFTKDFVFIEGETAELLADMRVPIVGLDYLSVERFGSHDAPVHNKLLSADIPIIEGLCLSGVKEGRYTLAVFPIRLHAREAAPARAVLFSPPLASSISLTGP